MQAPFPPRKRPSLTHLYPQAFHFLIFLCGLLLPPLAVLIRFGVGRDFYLNILFTLMGYFPGHGHNFYLQNIRNNKNKNRSPKWAVRYGLVKDYNAKAKKRRDWANRYEERNSSNPYDDPSHQAEDEWGNPVLESEPRSGVPNASTDSYEPASARHLERRPTAESDDTEEFYRPEDAQVGSAPGSDEVQGRNKTGLRTLVTGTTSRDRRPAKKDRFAAMEQERNSRGYGDYDRMDDQQRRGAQEIDPDTLQHEF